MQKSTRVLGFSSLVEFPRCPQREGNEEREGERNEKDEKEIGTEKDDR